MVSRQAWVILSGFVGLAVLGAVVALSAPQGPLTLPMPAGTVIRITDPNVSVATFTVGVSGGHLVGAYQTDSFSLVVGDPGVRPGPRGCPSTYWSNRTLPVDVSLGPGAYALWPVCGAPPPLPHPATILITQVVQVLPT